MFGIGVLMPSIYTPYSLTEADVSRSPFLTSLDKLLAARICLKDMGTKTETPGIAKADIAQALSDIDAYMDTFRSGSTPVRPGTTGPPSGTAKAAESGQNSAAPGVPALLSGSASSSLLSILAADDLAQKLSFSSAANPPDAGNEGKHVLVLKALESGGTVTRKSNILGTKVRYSGGSVGTYSLFNLGGELECSGNVYAYGGPISDKKFQRDLGRFVPDTSNQFIFQMGGCSAAASH
jgi:hypothetical protein